LLDAKVQEVREKCVKIASVVNGREEREEFRDKQVV
jgi:hypothetical protein